jgi:hypothetical protein
MNAKEKVAAKLGLKLHLDSKWQLYIHEITAYMGDFGTNTPAGHWLSHLIVQKLVEEGWGIVIEADKYNGFIISGRMDSVEIKLGHFSIAPAATFALACKAWGITE